MTQLFGADNPAYRGGVTRLKVLIRNSRMYKQWRDLVYQRDRYKCVDCGIVGDRLTLEADHINIEFSELVQELLAHYPQYKLPEDEAKLMMLSQVYSPMWKIVNGTARCKLCHRKRHKKAKEQNG